MGKPINSIRLLWKEFVHYISCSICFLIIYKLKSLLLLFWRKYEHLFHDKIVPGIEKILPQNQRSYWWHKDQTERDKNLSGWSDLFYSSEISWPQHWGHQHRLWWSCEVCSLQAKTLLTKDRKSTIIVHHRGWVLWTNLLGQHYGCLCSVVPDKENNSKTGLYEHFQNECPGYNREISSSVIAIKSKGYCIINI